MFKRKDNLPKQNKKDGHRQLPNVKCQKSGEQDVLSFKVESLFLMHSLDIQGDINM